MVRGFDPTQHDITQVFFDFLFRSFFRQAVTPARAKALLQARAPCSQAGTGLRVRLKSNCLTRDLLVHDFFENRVLKGGRDGECIYLCLNTIDSESELLEVFERERYLALHPAQGDQEFARRAVLGCRRGLGVYRLEEEDERELAVRCA
jgi:hypothetical protein